MSLHRTFGMLALVSLLAPGCAKKQTALQVLQPGAVNIPNEIQTVAIVDRAEPANAGQTILGVLEAAVTGETILGDPEGRRTANGELVMVLSNSPRFEVIVPNVTKQQIDSGVWDKPMSFKKVKSICQKHGCDGIIALEAFDSDSYVDHRRLTADEKPEGSDDNYIATRYTRVLTSYRFYDANQNRILDYDRAHSYDQTWEQRGPSVEAALARLPQHTETIRTLGGKAGNAYGRRIAPTWVTVMRSYYVKGDPRLKQAKNHVRVNDFDGAINYWRDIADTSMDPKLKGKALHNMAVAAEVEGDLDKALSLAREAAVVFSKGTTRSYVYQLEARIRDQQRLAEQLAPPPEPVPATAPRTKPPANAGADQRTGNTTDEDEEEDAGPGPTRVGGGTTEEPAPSTGGRTGPTPSPSKQKPR